MTDLDRLRRLLGGPDTAWLVERVRRRIENGQPLTGTVSLTGPAPAQRRAVELLLGRPPGKGASLVVSLDDVDAALRRSGAHPGGLAAAVTTLAGPIRDRASTEATVQAAWTTAFAPLGRVPAARVWAEDIQTKALIRRLCTDPGPAAALVADLAAVLSALPADGLPLARFAAETVGDEHALDHGRPLATLALSAIRRTWAAGLSEVPTPAQHRRALWDAVGVLLDELSSTVLALNLPTRSGGGLHRLVATAPGEPLVLTLRQLAREATRFEAVPVFVCENPAVVAAAADLLGAACPPLVCVGGQPSTAAVRLLTGLSTAGARLRYHGDFDWGGIRIANLLWSRLPMTPWRYDTPAYLAAVSAGKAGRPLAGIPAEPLWDSRLRAALVGHGRRVAEERVLPELLADLENAETR